MKISPLKPEQWPAADRTMWNALTACGDVLDEAGPCAHWRQTTKLNVARDYGYWLAYLQHAGVGLDDETPITRITPQRVRDYVKKIASYAFSTRATRLMAILIIARRAAPNVNWEWMQRIHSYLDAEARRRRGTSKQDRIIATSKLFEVGLHQMIMAKEEQAMAPRKRAVLFRDGLTVAWLAARPLRIKNFAGMRLGRHIRRSGAIYRIDIAGDETKTGIPIETFLPHELVLYFEEYIQVHRPHLLDGAPSDLIWIAKTGRPYSSRHLAERISIVTRRLLGVSVNPHLFRDSAATTIAIADPNHVGVIAPILGHSTPSTAERYYNQARTLEAGRAHQANIGDLRKELVRARRRTSRNP